MAPRKKTVEGKVVDIGSVTKLVGETIKLKDVANYAVQELELRIEDSLNKKKVQLDSLFNEVVNSYQNEYVYKYKENKSKIQEVFGDKIKTLTELFGVKKISTSFDVNDYEIGSIFDSKGRTFTLFEKGLHIGIHEESETSEKKFFRSRSELYQTFKAEIPVKGDELNNFPELLTENNKKKELFAQWKKIHAEYKEILDQKENVKTDGKRLHLEVMKSEISKSKNGQDLVKEISNLLGKCETAKFLALKEKT